jgi:hypothetical protein
MGGKYDSSKTRVRPVFDTLWARGRDWLPTLLSLPEFGCGRLLEGNTPDLTLQSGFWEPSEKCLNPPIALLSYLIRHPKLLVQKRSNIELRTKLLRGDPDAVERALHLLRTEPARRGWYIFEGPTCPDVYLVSHGALVVIEGKRTESGPTVKTEWLAGRHQIWRHLDAAWETRGRREVYGFFVVESDGNPPNGSVPKVWREAANECLKPSVLSASFPHRSAEEAASISRCFLGVTTWQRICSQFCIDHRTLSEES